MSISDVIVRLDPLIRRLSSDHDGEIVSCVRAIERQLNKAGLCWHDLADRLISNVRADADDPSGPVFFDYAEAVDWLLGAHWEHLRAHELDFCESMRRSLNHRPPTVKQGGWIRGLVAKWGGRFDG